MREGRGGGRTRSLRPPGSLAPDASTSTTEVRDGAAAATATVALRSEEPAAKVDTLGGGRMHE